MSKPNDSEPTSSDKLQLERTVTLAEISRQCGVPASTVSCFVKAGLPVISNPKNKNEKRVNVSDLEAFLASDKAGKHRGKRYPEEQPPDLVPAVVVASSSASERPQSAGEEESSSSGQPDKPAKPQGQATTSTVSKAAKLKRRPCQLRHFKRSARRLSIGELQWAIRYCNERLHRLINTESDQLAQKAFKLEAELENAGKQPSAK